MELFRDSLEIWLRRRGLKDLDVWWDKEQLQGSMDFTARIEQLPATTVLETVSRCRICRQWPDYVAPS